MSSITFQRSGQYIYINESTSYWDKTSKQSANYKTRIGMIDTETEEKFYKQSYIDRLKREGKPTDGMNVWIDRRKRHGITSEANIGLAEEILATVKDYGIAHFLQHIAEKIGLIKILQEALPVAWRKLFILACYLLAEDRAIAFCSDWAEENKGMETENMSSQRISEMLLQLKANDRALFYKKWYEHIRENEYIALDITSISSYSGNIESLEWGYNRDGDDLPQVNLCMLFGETSRLPVYQTAYSGSMTDVTTLMNTLAEFTALTGTTDFGLIMDKGFYKAKNIDDMLTGDGKCPYRFLMPVSFTSAFPRRQIAAVRNNIDDIDNLIVTSGTPIRGAYRLCPWGKNGANLHTHIFFNPEKALKDRNALFEHVRKLSRQILTNPNDKRNQKDFKRYLVVTPTEISSQKPKVCVRKDVIEKELSTAGWFVLVSNFIEETQVAYDAYREKDVVEKSFYQYKNSLGMYRPRVHNDERWLNKVFVAFIALILSCHIHNTMKKNEFAMSFGKLLVTLSKIKVATINDRLIIRPLTKEQRTIFDCFDVPYPQA